MAIDTDATLDGPIVVILTSVGQLSEAKGLQSSAVHACLPKPVRPSQLLNALATAWSKKQTMLLAGVDQSREANSNVSAVSSVAGRFAGSALQVLIVEDNVVNQRAAFRMLERLGLKRGRSGERPGSSGGGQAGASMT